jgi:leucyl/phenylalanyl-tRNA--protein transferase
MTIDVYNGRAVVVETGGAVTVERMLHHHRRGAYVYPYDENSQVLWCRPPQRGVLFLDEVRVNKSTRRAMRRHNFSVTANEAFADVVQRCATAPRRASQRWMSSEINQA